jgi:hypothetical protein
MMWIVSLSVISASSVLTLLIKTFPSFLALCESFLPVLQLASSFLSRYTFVALTTIFWIFSLSASALVFFYPLEIETRESTVWLAVLALKAGVNIYDESKVVFVNLNHGPFDPLFKFAVSSVFPFLESWQITRFAVLLLPYAFLLVAWKLTAAFQSSGLRVLFLAGIGYLFLVVTAKEWLFVGRSDPTAALFLLLLCASVTFRPRTPMTAALTGLVCGTLASMVTMTNWRVAPTAWALIAFTWWLLVKAKRSDFPLGTIFATAYIVVSLFITCLMLYHVSGFNVPVYYQYFFGFYSKAAGWSTDAGYNYSLISFILPLFDPMGHGYSFKGGPLLLAIGVYALLPEKTDSNNIAWLVLSCVSFLFCTLAYYLNYWGGGSWYFLPFVIVLWAFLTTNSHKLPRSSLNLLGIVLLGLLCINFQTAVWPSISRVTNIRRAQTFMAGVRALEEKGSILSEDTFFFRSRYRGESIDMGDTVSVFAKSDYFSSEFKETVRRHFDQVKRHPPDYIITGFTESPELRKLIEDGYLLITEGPTNLTASHSQSTKLYRRKSL